jgi:exodeoxyribonuclease-3
MKIITWNVNGIRSKSMRLFDAAKVWDPTSPLARLLDAEAPDVLALNETKCSPCHTEALDAVEALADYEKFWNCSREKKGYAGTAVFTRVPPLHVTYGIDTLPEPDTEGRAITLEFEDMFVLATYVPNSGRSPERAAYRVDVWDDAVLRYVARLEETKPVCWVGDLNVVDEPQDVHRVPSPPTPGYLPRERSNLKRALQDHGLVDCFRALHPDAVAYTWWDYRTRGRAANRGWRIDYALASEALRPRLQDCRILDHVLGSDHCPVAVGLGP